MLFKGQLAPGLLKRCIDLADSVGRSARMRRLAKKETAVISGSTSGSIYWPTAARMTSAINSFDTVSSLLDLTKTPRPITGTLESSAGGTVDSLSMLAKLLQQGVVGTETYDVYCRPYTRFVETTLGDRRLNSPNPYRNRRVTGSRLNQTA